MGLQLFEGGIKSVNGGTVGGLTWKADIWSSCEYETLENKGHLKSQVWLIGIHTSVLNTIKKTVPVIQRGLNCNP